MGSMIYLTVGRLQVDWGKNHGFADHSPLFQVGDVTQLPYDFVEQDEDGRARTAVDGQGRERERTYSEYRDAISKPLWQVADRLRLLGFNLDYCRSDLREFLRGSLLGEDVLPFDDLASVLSTLDVSELSTGEDRPEVGFGRFFRSVLAPRFGVEAVQQDDGDYRPGPFNDIEDLGAYAVLLLLAENPDARDLPVSWHFAEVESGGWAEREAFERRPDARNRFLIVTEGSSDAAILRHALGMLRPHLADFFDFVDMEEGYPFTGTGNVHKFLQGLIAISIQNSVVVLYDNDAEGVASHRKSSALNVPANIRVIRLPDVPAFRSFHTVGPGGRFEADVNGQAAAIECYLDIGPDAVVRWTAFNRDTQSYQGELLGKTGYMRAFLDQRTRVDGYDYSKVEAVLDLVIGTCADMRAIRFEPRSDGEDAEPEG